MKRTPLFWSVFALAALLCGMFIWRIAPHVFPVIGVEITMDRESALSEAESLASTFGWGPEDYRSAASYQSDTRTQHFVELEAGGIEAFRTLLKDGHYHPFRWEVRLFQEREAKEVTVRFSPKGEPIGFRERLPESEEGAQLSSEDARILAETMANEHWNWNPEVWEFVESSENLQTGGRLDHSFVYELKDVAVGEAKYRIRLHVGGDRFTGVVPHMMIPEGFDRRYEEMRSRNNNLAGLGSILMVLVLLLCGCGFGLFYMLKERYVVWKAPLLFAALLGCILLVAQFNSWPLQWMQFDTALSYQNHMMQQLAIAVALFFVMLFGFGLIFMAAESLTRRAMPDHLQFWRLWTPSVAPTPQLLGLTTAALFLVPIKLAYVCGTYYATARYLGWWSPSSELFDPNILATYMPWWNAFALALQAGFWEESLFRAVPIAGAVLIGKRYGRFKLWLVGALLLQAIIFGAAHANYPQQPFYARLVELLLPSVGYGLVFYYLGLYPAILIHFWYNLTLMSIPLFASSAAGLFGSQVMVVAVGSIPFLIILGQWLRTKRFQNVDGSQRNAAWSPKPLEPKERETRESEPAVSTVTVLAPQLFGGLVVFGVVGFVAWALLSPFEKDASAMELNRSQALELADLRLQELGHTVPAEWKRIATVSGVPGDAHRYVMETGGRDAYEALMGLHLSQPAWSVRYLTFEGPVEERAEEFRVVLAGREPIRFLHRVPEHRPGASLEEAVARELVEDFLGGLRPEGIEGLKFISATSFSRPERVDWEMVYANQDASPLGLDEARYRIRLAGDQLAEYAHYVHIPEDWTRERREKQTFPTIIQIFSWVLLVSGVIAGVVVGVIHWSKGNFRIKPFIWVSATLFALMAISIALGWSDLENALSTSQAYLPQLLIGVGVAGVGFLFFALTFGILSGFVHSRPLPMSQTLLHDPVRVFIVGLAMAACYAGIQSLVNASQPPSPFWGDVTSAGSFAPFLTVALQPISGLLTVTLLLMALLMWVHHLTWGWKKRKAIAALLIILAGLVFAGLSVNTPLGWLVSGLLTGTLLLLAYAKVIRYHMPLTIPLVAGTQLLTYLVNQLSPMHAGSLAGCLLGLVALGAIVWIWYRSVTNPAS